MIYLVFHTVWKYKLSIVSVYEKVRGGVDFLALRRALGRWSAEMNEWPRRGSAEQKEASACRRG
jgi:hypothetical protein